MIQGSNKRASLDAAVAFCSHSEGHGRRASEPGRWVRSCVSP
jgi:hypothetical protein